MYSRLAMYNLREYGPHKAAEARRGYGDLSRDALQDILFAFTLEDYDGRLGTSRADRLNSTKIAVSGQIRARP